MPVSPPAAASRTKPAPSAATTTAGAATRTATAAAGSSSVTSILIEGLTCLEEAIKKGAGAAGVLGVAISSPLIFSVFPWLLAVLVVFLIGLAVELGPGAALDYLHSAQNKIVGEAGTAVSSHAHQSGKEGNQHYISTHWPTLAERPDFPFSLRGAKVEIKEFRVVEGQFASYKVLVIPATDPSWSVWKRYRDFEDLREALLLSSAAAPSPSDPSDISKNDDKATDGSTTISGSPLPLLPPKTLFKNLNFKFLTKRSESLQSFLRELMKRSELCDDPAMRQFLDAGAMAATSPSAQPGVEEGSQKDQEKEEQRVRASSSEEGEEEQGPRIDGERPSENHEAIAEDRIKVCRPGDPKHCDVDLLPLRESTAATADADDDDDEPYSVDRPTLSTASTDDGEDDEERAEKTAHSILETMRELSAHSPSEWQVGESSSSIVRQASSSSSIPPSSKCKGMPLAEYQEFSLRFQHPCAYYDPGATNVFHVRGKTYMVDGKKIPAGPPIGKLMLASVYKVHPDAPGDREDHIARHGEIARLLQNLKQLDARDGQPPFNFVLNFQVPGDPPLSLVFVFALPRDKRPAEDEDGNFWALFDRFVDLEAAKREGSRSPSPSSSSVTPHEGEFPPTDFRNKRFKLIPSIVDGPSMIRWAVGNKPTILGQKLTQRYFHSRDYLEVDVDIASSAIASQIVSLCRGYAKYLKVQMGIVLQGESEEELPEVLLGTIGIDNLDIDEAAEGYNY